MKTKRKRNETKRCRLAETNALKLSQQMALVDIFERHMPIKCSSVLTIHGSGQSDAGRDVA